jgi:hypothetical protein
MGVNQMPASLLVTALPVRYTWNGAERFSRQDFLYDRPTIFESL